jgi:dolichol-phosphate mannosyltransferase
MGEVISVMTPVYNEKDNLPLLVGSLEETFSKNEMVLELIIIDDNSPDGSGKIADQRAEKYGNIKVLHREEKMGLGTAYKDGFTHTSGDLVATIDCDLSHDPEELPHLIQAIGGKDIIIGSRLVKGGQIKGRNMWRDFLSYTANWFIRLITGYKINDWTSGYRVYRRHVLEKVFPQVECMKWDFQFDVLYVSLLSGYEVEEMPITFKDRGGGKSKFSLKEAFTFMFSVLKILFNKE